MVVYIHPIEEVSMVVVISCALHVCEGYYLRSDHNYVISILPALRSLHNYNINTEEANE